MMIRLVAQDSECPVELLDKYETHQLVGKSHLAQGDFFIGTVIDRRREAVGASDHEHQALAAAGHAPFEPLAEIDRRALAAVLVEQHHVVAVLERGKQAPSLGHLLLGFAHVAGGLDIADILDVERHIVLQALHIFLDTLPDKCDLGLTYYGQCNLHIQIVLSKNIYKISNSAKNSLTLWSQNH